MKWQEEFVEFLNQDNKENMECVFAGRVEKKQDAD
jgi:hypothetical protein